MSNSEKEIIKQLELDAKTPFAKIGKNTKMSQQRVSYTVNALASKNIIQNFYTLIDYSKFDVLMFRVYMQLNYINEEKLNKFINYLKKENHTAWINSCGGRYDLICTFFASNPSQFNKTLRKIMAKFPNQILDYTVLTTIVNRIFKRKYFFQNNDLLDQHIVGGDREPVSVDETDLQILNTIAEDARVNACKICNNLNLTSKTVIERIKKLKERKIIRDFKTLLNPEEYGYETNVFLIRYHNISTDIENNLINFLKHHKNVLWVVKTLGEWDIEVVIETKNHLEERKIKRELRDNFGVLIQQIDTMPLYETHKLNYFPKFILDRTDGDE